MTTQAERADGRKVELQGDLAEVYDFICRFYYKRGYCPTFREIQAGAGLSSSSVAKSKIEALVSLRVVLQEGNTQRTIRPANYATRRAEPAS